MRRFYRIQWSENFTPKVLDFFHFVLTILSFSILSQKKFFLSNFQKMKVLLRLFVNLVVRKFVFNFSVEKFFRVTLNESRTVFFENLSFVLCRTVFSKIFFPSTLVLKNFDLKNQSLYSLFFECFYFIFHF